MTTIATNIRETVKIAKSKSDFSDSLIESVCRRIAKDLRVRRTLPGKGRLHIDRQVPFLCVYRQPSDHEDAGTEQLVKGEASYLIASGADEHHVGVAKLVRAVVETLSIQFGAFLVVELWAAPDGGKANDPAIPTVLPTFKVYAANSARITRTVEALEKRLKKIKVLKQGVQVKVERAGQTHPPHLPPLLSAEESRQLNCWFVGVAIPPVFRSEHHRRVSAVDQYATAEHESRAPASLFRVCPLADHAPASPLPFPWTQRGCQSRVGR